MSCLARANVIRSFTYEMPPPRKLAPHLSHDNVWFSQPTISCRVGLSPNKQSHAKTIISENGCQ